ncbi:hypothetical protein A5866_000336 [Enterococcus sp. 12C11_DIV0727]|uniref:Uncharacterized protein n=1 Tax=Candidatus Enterococcus lemimoniae TaxID=1834167 RepID=A0ABZ2T1T5_9ENTE
MRVNKKSLLLGYNYLTLLFLLLQMICMPITFSKKRMFPSHTVND